MDRPRALVIGGSLGGLFAACLLRSVGWDATVFERTTGDLAGRGAGLGTRAELFAVMRRIGIDLDPSIGTAVRARIGLAASGARFCEVPLASVTTAWDRIYRALKAALPADCYRPGAQLERFEQDAHKVAARFADGARADGDLLVGADGILSTVRRQLMPGVTPRYAGYVSWRGVAQEGPHEGPHEGPQEGPHEGPGFDPIVFDHMTFCFPDCELALTVPTPPADARGSSRRCHFSWFRPAHWETELPRLMTDADGRRHGISIPPPLIRPELIDRMRAEASERLAPQIAAVIAATGRPLLQPIFDLSSPRMVFGRVVLLGDAAFVARPHVGTGVTKAALDAQGLADALREHRNDVDAALARYDAERTRFGAWLVARGRYLGAWIEEQQSPADESAGAWRNRSPDDFIREFGGAGMGASLTLP